MTLDDKDFQNIQASQTIFSSLKEQNFINAAVTCDESYQNDLEKQNRSRLRASFPFQPVMNNEYE